MSGASSLHPLPPFASGHNSSDYERISRNESTPHRSYRVPLHRVITKVQH